MIQSEKHTPDDKNYKVTNSNPFFEKWTPSIEEYTPGFSKEQWLILLHNDNIIGPIWGGVLAAFYEFGGASTCLQIAQKYHRSPSSISGNCTQLAKRIYKETRCPLLTDEDGKNKYWPILFQGKDAGPDVEGKFIWKIRPELYDALTEFDILRYRWDIETKTGMDEVDPRKMLTSVLEKMGIPYADHVKNVNFTVEKEEDVRVYFRQNAVRFNLRLWLANRFRKIDDSLYYYSDKIKADLPPGVINPTPFVYTHNIEAFLRSLYAEDDLNDINSPKEPHDIYVLGDSIRVICGRCGYDFRKANRCPECGQLVKVDS